MWAPLPPAAYTSLVGTRHKVNEREPSVREAIPGCSAIAAGTQTHTWRPSEARLEARGPEESGFLQGLGSVPGWCGKEGQVRVRPPGASTHATPLAPQSLRSRVHSNEALSCTYRVRSKVIVKAAAGKRCSPELWKLLSTFCPASNSDLVFLFLIHEGEFLVWLPWGSSPHPVWASESWAALLKDA